MILSSPCVGDPLCYGSACTGAGEGKHVTNKNTSNLIGSKVRESAGPERLLSDGFHRRFIQPSFMNGMLVLWQGIPPAKANVSQTLRDDAFPDGGPSLLWAGDLDRDGKLDLLLDVTNHYNVSEIALFLSSLAGQGRDPSLRRLLSGTGARETG